MKQLLLNRIVEKFSEDRRWKKRHAQFSEEMKPRAVFPDHSAQHLHHPRAIEQQYCKNRAALDDDVERIDRREPRLVLAQAK